MRKLILILLVLSKSTFAQTDSVDFSENFNNIYKYKVSSLCFAVGGTGLIAGGGVLLNNNPNTGFKNTKRNAGMSMCIIGGGLLVASFVSYIMEIDQYKYMRDKKVVFTGDGILINLPNNTKNNSRKKNQ